MSGSACIRLSYVDSNHDRQIQKLQCYHYTIRQSLAAKACALNHATKLLTKSRPTKFFRDFNEPMIGGLVAGLKQTGAGSMGKAADPVMSFDRLTAPA